LIGNINQPRSLQNYRFHPFYEGLFVKPFFGVRGFVLAFRHIFESSEFGDVKHSRTEDDLQLDPALRSMRSMVFGCLVPWDVGVCGSYLPPSTRAAVCKRTPNTACAQRSVEPRGKMPHLNYGVCLSPRDETGIFTTKTAQSFTRSRCALLPQSPHPV
jgi:hypothetical protein